jgi:hypothetical protein
LGILDLLGGAATAPFLFAVIDGSIDRSWF